MTAQRKIYWFKAQAPRRVLALMKHLALPGEFIELDMMGGALRSKNYRTLNPNMKAPTLVEGDFVLWESSAIMAHLCIAAGSNMWPSQNPQEQVEILRWLSWSNSHWDQAVAPFYFEHIVKGTFKFAPPDFESLPAHLPKLRALAKLLDDHLADRTYVACGRLTIADFQLASMACDWKEAEMPFETCPHVLRWLNTLETLPAWKNPWPDSPST